jgi:hypothetical protein
MNFFGDIAGGSPYKPSLFELVAQEQLRDLLQPALKYVLTVRLRLYLAACLPNPTSLSCLKRRAPVSRSSRDETPDTSLGL